MTSRLALLGGLGDLGTRYLLPALAELLETERLPDSFAVVVVDRKPLSDVAFREAVSGALAKEGAHVGATARRRLTELAAYRCADVTSAADLRHALRPDLGPLIAYLALPPAAFEPTVVALASAGVGAESRIVLEKPFATDLESAIRLNDRLRGSFPEDHVHRVDHFLGKQTAQNLLGLRFANRIFEPVWNAHHIAGVDIAWDETLDVAGREQYYDATGALRDMVQNHLLQLLCLVAMEPPATLGERDLRDRKVDVLRAVRRLQPKEVEAETVRARYAGYAELQGVEPTSATETFAALRLFVDNWRWAGVPFLLRTGKALGRDRKEIAIRFQAVPHLAFGQAEEPRPNVLRLELDPDRMALELAVNGPGDPFSLDHIELDATFAPQEPSAYARVLLDVLAGDAPLSIRSDEIEESWRIVTPVLTAWSEGAVPLLEYAPRSDGPARADELACRPR